MSDHPRWDHDAPPLEAYSRVSNPERFRPLHAHALAVIERLTAAYAVVRRDAFTPLPGMSPFAHARSPVTLTPTAGSPGPGAPLAFAFTAFPSVIVRYGRWLAAPFPACGCDACGETADEEGERLERLVAAVVTDGLREELTIPWVGEARLRWWLGASAAAGHPSEAAFQVLPRAWARVLRGPGPGSVRWQPWRRHPADAVGEPAT
jgi:hypothetical protein